MSLGKVLLVGAGPGDVSLVTVKALDAIRRADVLVYDRLGAPGLLRFARVGARLLDVGKTPGRDNPSQIEINRILIEEARAGRLVVRLKGGDPFVFGRGGEEMLALADAGVPFEVVPGVTSGIAAAAYAGIPVTHRGYAACVTFVTGRTDPSRVDAGLDWASLAHTCGTLVFYMGVAELPNITRELIEAGLDADTPAAVVQEGTTPRQRSVRGKLGEIAHLAAEAGIRPPAIIVIGKVASFPESLGWFERLPLFGKRIVVTRAREQADAAAERLAALGAEPILFPTIEIAEADDPLLQAALDDLGAFDWAVFTSANAAERFFDRLFAEGRDARALGGLRIAAMGPATAEALMRRGLRADLVPATATGALLAEELAAQHDLAGKRVLLPRSDLATPEFPERLRRAGAQVTEVVAYRTCTTACPDPPTLARIARGEVDVVTFTSPSTVTGFVEVLGLDAAAELAADVRFAAIGPVTAQALADAGLPCQLTAEDHTMDGLIDTLCGKG